MQVHHSYSMARNYKIKKQQKKRRIYPSKQRKTLKISDVLPSADIIKIWNRSFIHRAIPNTAVNYNVSNSSDLLTRTDLVVCARRQSFPSVGIFYGQNPLDYSFPLLMVELTVVVKVTQLVRFLLKPLKQPGIVSQIIVSFLTLCNN